MNQYEGIFIINTTLDPQAIKKATTDIQDILTREGGQIVNVEEWGRRKLAYEVKKHSDGHYVLVNFDLPGVKISRVKELVILNENIIRHIIVRRVPRPEVTDAPREDAGMQHSYAE